MTQDRPEHAAPSTRANIVVSLPEGEQAPVIEALLSAGFGIAEAFGPPDLVTLTKPLRG